MPTTADVRFEIQQALAAAMRAANHLLALKATEEPDSYAEILQEAGIPLDVAQRLLEVRRAFSLCPSNSEQRKLDNLFDYLTDRPSNIELALRYSESVGA